MPTPREVLEGAGPLARRLHQNHTRLWSAEVDAQLTGPQFTVLAVLLDLHEADHSTLSHLAHMDKSTLTPLLARLQQRGLIDIESDESDRRRRIVSITAAGRVTVSELSPAAGAVAQTLLANLSPAEQEDLLRLLHKAVEPPD